MKVKLISQASVIIYCSDVTIWTDPWLEGKAFNNSWSLYPEPDFDSNELNHIDYLWISHEHPDHFHIQTLKNLPDSFKSQVTVLFQDKKNPKMLEAFNRLGFNNIKLIPNSKLINITTETSIYVHQVGGIDSCLGVKNGGKSLLNLNDCELTKADQSMITNRFSPKIDVLLNQFSLAGNNGSRADIPKISEKAKDIVNGMLIDHEMLNTDITIPFASFVYFSSVTNRYINKYHNHIRDVKHEFDKNSFKFRALYINEVFDLNAPVLDDTIALDKFTTAQQNYDNLPYDTYPVVPFEELKKNFIKRCNQLKECYPKFILNRLKTMTAYVEDSGYAVKFSVADSSFELEDDLGIDETDLVLYSQPLSQAFGTTWGVQTMGVGAQYFIERNQNTWKWYRIVTVLNNANVYLKPKYLFTSEFISYVVGRLKSNGLSQLLFRIRKT